MVKESKRLSNIEALRIFALISVVAIHVCEPAVLAFPTNSINWAFANAIDGASRVGVDIFILIAGYFLCMKNLTLKGIARRWLLILYPLMVVVLVYFLYSPPTSVPDATFFLKQLSQGTSSSYHRILTGHLWYIYPFLLMVALSPLMNHAISSMDRETYRKVLLVLVTIVIIPHTVEDFTTSSIFFQTNDTLFYFLALYFVAGYIRKFDVRVDPKKTLGLWLITTASVIALCYYYTNVIQAPSVYVNKAYTSFYGFDDLLVFLGAIFLFMAFRQMELKSRVVSLCGKFTYDAYLVHLFFVFIILNIWPFDYTRSTPFLDYSTHALGVIGVVVALSMGYGLLRYAMDLGLMAAIKRADIRERVRSWSARQEGNRPKKNEDVETPRFVTARALDNHGGVYRHDERPPGHSQ